jgi:hypothetical protein
VDLDDLGELPSPAALAGFRSTLDDLGPSIWDVVLRIWTLFGDRGGDVRGGGLIEGGLEPHLEQLLAHILRPVAAALAPEGGEVDVDWRLVAASLRRAGMGHLGTRMLAYTVFGTPGDDSVWTVSFTHVSGVLAESPEAVRIIAGHEGLHRLHPHGWDGHDVHASTTIQRLDGVFPGWRDRVREAFEPVSVADPAGGGGTSLLDATIGDTDLPARAAAALNEADEELVQRTLRQAPSGQERETLFALAFALADTVRVTTRHVDGSVKSASGTVIGPGIVATSAELSWGAAQFTITSPDGRAFHAVEVDPQSFDEAWRDVAILRVDTLDVGPAAPRHRGDVTEGARIVVAEHPSGRPREISVGRFTLSPSGEPEVAAPGAERALGAGVFGAQGLIGMARPGSARTSAAVVHIPATALLPTDGAVRVTVRRPGPSPDDLRLRAVEGIARVLGSGRRDDLRSTLVHLLREMPWSVLERVAFRIGHLGHEPSRVDRLIRGVVDAEMLRRAADVQLDLYPRLTTPTPLYESAELEAVFDLAGEVAFAGERRSYEDPESMQVLAALLDAAEAEQRFRMRSTTPDQQALTRMRDRILAALAAGISSPLLDARLQELAALHDIDPAPVALAVPDTSAYLVIGGNVAELADTDSAGTTVGTSHDADVRIVGDDLGLMPRHAYVQFDGGIARVAPADRGSVITVNGRVSTGPTVLRDGDVIVLGDDTRIVFLRRGDVATAGPSISAGFPLVALGEIDPRFGAALLTLALVLWHSATRLGARWERGPPWRHVREHGGLLRPVRALARLVGLGTAVVAPAGVLIMLFARTAHASVATPDAGVPGGVATALVSTLLVLGSGVALVVALRRALPYSVGHGPPMVDVDPAELLYSGLQAREALTAVVDHADDLLRMPLPARRDRGLSRDGRERALGLLSGAAADYWRGVTDDQLAEVIGLRARALRAAAHRAGVDLSADDVLLPATFLAHWGAMTARERPAWLEPRWLRVVRAQATARFAALLPELADALLQGGRLLPDVLARLDSAHVRPHVGRRQHGSAAIGIAPLALDLPLVLRLTVLAAVVVWQVPGALAWTRAALARIWRGVLRAAVAVAFVVIAVVPPARRQPQMSGSPCSGTQLCSADAGTDPVAAQPDEGQPLSRGAGAAVRVHHDEPATQEIEQRSRAPPPVWWPAAVNHRQQAQTALTELPETPFSGIPTHRQRGSVPPAFPWLVVDGHSSTGGNT